VSTPLTAAGYVWDLLLVLVRKELKLRYRGTSLGILWSLGNPIALAVVLHVAFRRVLDVDIDRYAAFILSALFPWQWFSNSITEGSKSFLENGDLIKKLPFPRIAIPAAVVAGDLVHFVITLPVLALVLVWESGTPPPVGWASGVPLLVALQASLTLGAVVIVASAHTLFRDIGQLTRVALLLLFYVTPILFPASMLPPDLRWLLVANPLAPIISCWRHLVMKGSPGPLLPAAVVWTLLVSVTAAAVYRSIRPRLAELV